MKIKRNVYRRIRRNAVGADVVRGADGHVRPTSEADIGDVWAQQKRLQLKDAILADRKKRDRKERRRGFFGGVKTESVARGADGAKTVEIKIQVPDLPWQRLSQATKAIKRRLIKHTFNKKQKLIAGSTVALALLVILSFGLTSSFKEGDMDERLEAGGVLGQKQSSGPEYRTLLPAGKSIDDLGGWGRVSPPDKEPVFAFIDSVSGMRINVSQQPLPDNFKSDTAGEVRKLAESLSANEEVIIGGTTAYVGTSVQGQQSAILVKNSLLILIKSEAELTKEQWIVYLASLR